MNYYAFAAICEHQKVKPNSVGKAAGVSSSTIAGWKKGKEGGGYRPKIGKLEALADELHVPLSEFMLEDDSFPFEHYVKICSAKSLSADEVAWNFGVKFDEYNAWKNGDALGLNNAVIIAGALGITMSELASGVLAEVFVDGKAYTKGTLAIADVITANPVIKDLFTDIAQYVDSPDIECLKYAKDIIELKLAKLYEAQERALYEGQDAARAEATDKH